MAAYLLNGASTAGKTTIGNVLAERGYKVIDTDETFGYYGNLATEKPVEFPGGDRVTAEWYAENNWIWDRQKVKATLDEADETIFFCGGAMNETVFYPRFAKIFHLYLTPEALIARNSQREAGGHTNNPAKQERMLEFLKKSKEYASSLGMVVIDTSQGTPEASADEILGYINEA